MQANDNYKSAKDLVLQNIKAQASECESSLLCVTLRAGLCPLLNNVIIKKEELIAV